MADKIKAKIVYFFPAQFIGEYSSYSEEPAVFSGATDWEEITEEELRIIQSGKVMGPSGETVVALVEPNPEDKRVVMKTVRENIQKAKEEIAEDLEKDCRMLQVLIQKIKDSE